jgi:hypothetical protein
MDRKLKVLMLNGSPRENGNIALAFREMERVLARNMVFLMQSIILGKDQIGLPKTEDRVWTNFTR